jgi:hypothetical protein
MRLWLDDIRPASEGWTWVKTAQEAIDFLKTGEVTEASLDHDLGEDQPEGRTVALWMAEHDVWPKDSVAIHSGNPVAVEYMSGVIERYGPYRKLLGKPAFRR